MIPAAFVVNDVPEAKVVGFESCLAVVATFSSEVLADAVEVLAVGIATDSSVAFLAPCPARFAEVGAAELQPPAGSVELDRCHRGSVRHQPSPAITAVSQGHVSMHRTQMCSHPTLLTISILR